MAGAGIRYWEIANSLSGEFSVVLAAPGGCDLVAPTASLTIMPYHRGDWLSLQAAWDQADVAFFCGDTLWDYPHLEQTTKPKIIDCYDIAVLEELARFAGEDAHAAAAAQRQRHEIVDRSLRAGDFFVCATERQRDWWLGALDRAGRINRSNYLADPTFRQLIDIVPYGCPASPPIHTRVVMRTAMAGIRPADRIVLWGGGIWPWLDADTAVRAAGIVARQRSDVRFVFPGTKHPAHPSAFEACHRARQLADDLGLANRFVFFGDWAPYADWQNYLLEADIGLSLHHEHVETRFSSRSRVLSYVWGKLPMVLTQGDSLGAEMAAAGVATLVGYGDAEQVARAVMSWLKTIAADSGSAARLNERFEALRQRWSWDNAVKPLADFCRAPRQAPDKLLAQERARQ